MAEARTGNNAAVQAFNRYRAIAASIAEQASSRSAQWASGTSSQNVLRAYSNLLDARVNLTEIRQVAGIAAVAELFYGNTYDAAAGFNSLITEIDATITLIRNLHPKDSNGYLQGYQFGTGLTAFVDRQFTGAQLGSIRAQLDSLAAVVVP